MWHTMDTNEVQRRMKVDCKRGLSEKEVQARREKYGLNKLQDKKKESIFIKFIKQFNDFMIIILIIASIVSFFITKLDGSNDYIDSIIIIGIVVLNSIMGVIQEAKAEKSLEALKKMSTPLAKVKREGRVKSIDSDEIVPGDILILESGNYVPADARLIESYNLKVEESALTGETEPVLKESKNILDKDVVIGDMTNLVFATTMIVNGHGTAIVTETGMNTKVGKIANMIIADEAPETPIQKKLAEVGKVLGVGCLIICVAVFIIGVIKKIEPIEMFMTSVGLAVAAIPEGLPAIVTIMLSIGVTKMAKKNAIIRKLPAVETLGSSSVICSDKTGTLTQNKMTVVTIADVKSQRSINDKFNIDTNKFILKLGTMCTDANIESDGIKAKVIGEPTEVAIVNAALTLGESKNEIYQMEERINEIPFDSTRKLMTTIHKNNGKYRIITKGAPDILLKRCTKYYENGNIRNITESVLKRILQNNTDMANQALRVLAVAFLDVDAIPSKVDSQTVEKNLVFARINRNDRSTKRRCKRSN